jgi:prevent-host-death family protein
MVSSVAEQVSYRVFREKLASFLRRAQQGAEIAITIRGHEVARLIPAAERAQRPFGLLEGEIVMAPDFDATPDDVIAAMEGRGDRG